MIMTKLNNYSELKFYNYSCKPTNTIGEIKYLVIKTDRALAVCQDTFSDYDYLDMLDFVKSPGKYILLEELDKFISDEEYKEMFLKYKGYYRDIDIVQNLN